MLCILGTATVARSTREGQCGTAAWRNVVATVENCGRCGTATHVPCG